MRVPASFVTSCVETDTGQTYFLNFRHPDCSCVRGRPNQAPAVRE